MVSEPGNRPFDDGGAKRALTDLPRHVANNRRVVRPAHLLKCPLYVLIRDQAQEWRLTQFYGQTLTERLVEIVFARFVIEVG